MFIKCPNCSIDYEVPDKHITDKPRKLRCSQCKNIFAVARRGSSIPIGFEVYAGRNAVQYAEFVYLRRTPDKTEETDAPTSRTEHDQTLVGIPQPKIIDDKEPNVAQVQQVSDTSRVAVGGGPTAAVGSAPLPATDPADLPPSPAIPPTDAGHQLDNDVVEQAIRRAQERVRQKAQERAESTAPDPLQASSSQSQGEELASPPPETNAAAVSPPLVASTPAKSAPIASSPVESAPAESEPVASSPVASSPVPSTSTVPDIYDSAVATWETEAPLELDDYVAKSAPSAAQMAGKVMFVLVIAVTVFFVFVAFRNDWELSFDKLGDQIGTAFSTGSSTALPAELEGLEVIIRERRVLHRNRKPPLLIVTGRVFNNTPYRRARLLLIGSVLDADDKLRRQARLPCDKVISDALLKKARAVVPLYRDRDGFHNCKIGPESTAVFQLVFEDPPQDFDDTFRVEVMPVVASASD
ncbi:MAG: zinc-ribbon domain-containing protein [Myxococcota bacterium]|nr:zinc-ribbon domain-containing protein [Myxococcota bacterium]